MNLRPRAAAIILNEANELLVLKQKNPETGFEWWTLPGGRDVKEECNVNCRPLQLIYMSEYMDYNINTHHLGMFFLTHIDDIENLKPGIDPEVDTQYIIECRFISEKALIDSKIPIYPPVFKEQFWRDLENNFIGHEIYQRGKLLK